MLAPPPPFPVLGVAAPLVVSVAVWAVTRSPYALLFAALGPVVAVAGVADQRIGGRRSARRARREARAAAERLHAEVRTRIAAARVLLRSRAPSARGILDGSANPALLWRAHPGGDGAAPVLVLGTGEVPSGMVWRGDPQARVPGEAPADRSRVRLRPRLLPLRRLPLRRSSPRRIPAAEHPALRWADAVGWVPDAPVLVPAAGGLGLRGAPAVVAPVLRGIVVQLVHALPPDDLRIVSRPAGPAWDWLARLPHAADLREPEPDAVGASEPGASCIRMRIAAREVVLAAAHRVEALPAACRTVLDVGTPGAACVLAAGTAAEGAEARVADPATAARAFDDDDGAEAGTPRLTRTGRVRLELVSLHEAERLAAELAELARRRGLAAARAPLPARVPFADLASEAGSGTAAARGLAAVIGVGHAGPVAVDLVADGPHAVVAGTTGSGKSELLVTWIAALAAAHPPEEVTVLLVDFKGGAAFDPLLVLPHAVGLVTDLDGQGAHRALDSLRAEVRHRERTLRACGARDVDDPAAAGALPRLVIVVDELAALLADQDGLHEVVADVAARGRSLGMHLILCTQRPAGVVRDSVLANCDLRLSLRVNNEADSRALLGTAEAARLADAPVGRCLVAAHGAAARPVQVAVTTADDLARIAASRAARAPLRRPWSDPLPPRVPLAALAQAPQRSATSDPETPSTAPTTSDGGGPAIPFALVDLPAEQRRATAVWRPAVDGHLVVVGGTGSGRSTCLRTLGASARAGGVEVHEVPGDVEGCWDAVAAVVARIRRSDGPRDRLIVLVDDLDVAVSRLAPDHQAALLEMMAVVVREGPHAGVALAVTGRRAGGPLQVVAAAAGPPVLLALPSRQEHLLADGEPRLFDPRATPGAGEWRGERIQVALPPDGPEGTAGAAGTARTARTARTAGTAGAPAGAPDHATRVALCAGDVHALVTPSPALAVAGLRGLGIDAVEASELPSGWSPPHPFPAQATGAGATGSAHAPAREGIRLRVVVADPDAWLLRGPLLAALRRAGSVVLEGCVPRDARTLLRVRDVPPPLAPVPGRAWIIAPDGRTGRCSWPPATVAGLEPARHEPARQGSGGQEPGGRPAAAHRPGARAALGRTPAVSR
ncbi:FtsK/SpoIIIE domain-containing protein [Clavibacter michiganensis]|uniref:FtsK/SpoIIIE domain-containing protein n=1 Tax=Clavibacter michiganensis TaxID=28447 RepID=UPI0021588BF8|nr:FtsK/SpoIIIE domain-containing protein [Clavibacter michiganensis]